MADYKDPRPSPTASAADPCVIYDNAVSFNEVVNGETTVTTYTGKELLTISQALDKFGFGVAPFTFAIGGTLDSLNLLVSNSPTDGFLYKYVGAGSAPIIVTAGTDPTISADWQAFAATGHPSLTGRNPADGSAHNADDILYAPSGFTVEAEISASKLVNIELTDLTSELESIVTVESSADIAALNKSYLSSISSSLDGKHYNISSTVNGLENTPDTIKMLDGRYANRVGAFKANRIGVFKTSDSLGHRVGDIYYSKISQTEAKLITSFEKYKSYTIADTNKAGLVIAYTDWAKVNDNTGDGFTWATAKASIAQALALNPDILLIRGGFYNRVNRFNSFSVNKNLAVIAVGGPVICGVIASGTWTKTAGQTNVYQLDYASGLTNATTQLHDTVQLNAQGAPIGYTNVASVALVDSTPASFYHTGTTTYVHALDSRDLIFHGDELRLMQPVDNSTITFNGNYKLYFEGIENWGGSGVGVTLISNGTAWANSVFYNKNCKFNAVSGGASNGFSVRDIGICISENSESSANRRDGFNYHNYLAGASGVNGVAPHFVEINCQAHGNGLLGSEGNNQGSTAHEDCVGFRINGDYSGHADGGCIVDIQGVKVYNVCCKAKNSSIVGMLLAADGFDRGSGILPATWWIDGAYCSGNPSISNAVGDISLDGFYSVLHIEDTVTEKPLSTRTFSDSVQPPDTDFS